MAPIKTSVENAHSVDNSVLDVDAILGQQMNATAAKVPNLYCPVLAKLTLDGQSPRDGIRNLLIGNEADVAARAAAGSVVAPGRTFGGIPPLARKSGVTNGVPGKLVPTSIV
jgi:hypothetical protein